jgi:hypothetical protein
MKLLKSQLGLNGGGTRIGFCFFEREIMLCTCFGFTLLYESI